jgi:hypothetical protein
MIEASAQIDGIQQIMAALQDLPESFDAAARQVAETMRELVVGASPYDTGHFKESWGQVESHAGGFSFSNPVDYGVILEEGLYPAVGPRTVSVGGGIFSRQAPGGIIRPLLDDPSVIDRIARLVVEEMVRGIERA